VAQANQNRKKIGIIEVGTFVIALLAFFLSIWQMRQTIRHNKLSVQPKIAVWVDSDDENQVLEISIENNGIGPAVLGVISAQFQDETIVVNGYKLEQFWMHAFELLNFSDTIQNNIYHTIIDEEFYLKEGDSLVLFRYESDSNCNKEYLRVKKELQNMIIQIPYCSIYEDCEVSKIAPREFYFVE
jgi:hypothetical protein